MKSGLVKYYSFIIIGFCLLIGVKIGLDYQSIPIIKPSEDLTNQSFLKKYHGIEKSKKSLFADQGHPDLFQQMHAEIRNNGPLKIYPGNYKHLELQKALQRAPHRLNKSLALPWVERGPGNVSGRTRTIVVDLDADPAANTWFAGAVSGGIWKTTNAGQSWRNLTSDLSNLAITSIDQCESNPDVLYAGTGEGGFFNLDAVDGSGLWKSTDRGESWYQIASTAEKSDFRNVFRLVVDPLDPDIVLVASQTADGSSILKTTDGGTSWKKVYLSSNRIQHIISNPKNFRTLYAAIHKTAIIRSLDAGESWSVIFDDFDPAPVSGLPGRIELAISLSDTNRIYVSLDQSNSRQDLYMSDDAGTFWSRIDDVSGNNPGILGSQGWYDHTIAVHPFNKNLVYIGGIQLYRIEIGDSTRKTNRIRSQTIPHVDHHNLTLIPFNEANNEFRIINGNDGGVWFSDNDGEDWTHTLNGYNTTQFYGADKRPGLNEYAGGMQDNGTWQSPPGLNASSSSRYLYRIGGDGYDVVFNSANPDEWIGGYQFNGFYLTTDNGTSYSFIGDQVESGDGPFVSTLTNIRSNPELVLTVGIKGVYRSDDFGRNWVLTPIPEEQWSFGNLLPIEQSLSNPQIVWAGRIMNNPNAGNKRLHLSSDGGVTFMPVNSKYSVTNLPQITGIATHPTSDSTAYLLFSGAKSPKILMTGDLGKTWNDISGFENRDESDRGFPDVAVYSLLVLPHEPTTLWAGTEIGLFESMDSGLSWHFADNGLPAVSIWQMKVSDDQIVLATHGRGIWSVTIPEIPSPPVVILPPSMGNPYQQPAGDLIVPLRLKQKYDSVIVYVDDQVFSKFSTDLVGDTTITYTVMQQKSLKISADGFVENQTYPTSRYTVSLFTPYSAESSYTNTFNSGTAEFSGTGFTINTPDGFGNPAIHSPHPYVDETVLTYQLVIPIEVSSSNAYLRFKEIAIIEPGEPGSVFGNFDFWDYVVVEATKDGKNWLPLVDGYDARANAAWRTRYDQGDSGDSSLFVQRDINILNRFSAGDVIYIRFKLFADAAANGWGWAIDDLEIQGELTSLEDNFFKPSEFRLGQNYPNPFNPVTSIPYELPREGKTKIIVYNNLGQKVMTLLDAWMPAGQHRIRFSGNHLASGVYYYRLESGSFNQVRKMMLMK